MNTQRLISFIRILLLVIAGSVILGQFGRIELSFGRAVYVHDPLLVVVTGLTALLAGKAYLRTLLRTKLFHVWFLFAFWVVFTSIINFHNDIPQLVTVGSYLTRLTSIFAFGASLYWLLKRRYVRRTDILIGSIGIGSAIALVGLVQYLFFPDIRGLKLLGWDDHYYRLVSTLFDPGFTGIVLALVSLFGIDWLLKRKSLGSPILVSSAVCTIALLLTYSRASYLAFLFGLVFLALRSKAYILFLALPLFLTCILLLPRPGGEGVKLERTASIISRVESIDSATRDVSGIQLLIGKGWYHKKQEAQISMVGSVAVPNHSSAAENSYVFIFSSLGLVGVLIVGYAGLLIGRTIAWESSGSVGAVAIGVHALFSNTWFHPFVLLLFVTMLVYAESRSTPDLMD